ncbi:unnamed protein product [Caenorhabditis angaria]|uniref:Uncharacterized protein n=1 Tax=Caenorhabditis angaria TaxID=860376 RepID=A0A9P1IQZ2_9PELO|nr:unnamed protein product [Caenorhabditis angaria]
MLAAEKTMENKQQQNEHNNESYSNFFPSNSNNNPMAMRMIASWDIDRATPSTVLRLINVSINRIVLDGVSPQLSSIIVTAKLPLSKRTRNLRSNEIKVSQNQGKIDLNCDISYAIQYPHFLKRKSNILQLVIQRRRKYKNRLPGGFKDLAIGNINLNYIMQQGGLREIALNAADSEMELKGAGLCVGRIELTSCYSQAPEHVDDRYNKSKKVPEDSDEDTETDYDDVDDLNEVGTSARSGHTVKPGDDNPRRRRHKNFRQKLTNMIRRFNKQGGSDEFVAENEKILANSKRTATAQELEALFEELSDFSDSGPEMMQDDISICSNPRPMLQPFFTRSREVLPAIYDGQEASESEGEKEENCWSSEAENNTKENQKKQSNLTQKFSLNSHQEEPENSKKIRLISNSFDNSTNLTHSTTFGSILDRKTTNFSSLTEQLAQLNLGSSSCDGEIAVWLCNLQDFPHFAQLSPHLNLINCPNSLCVKQTINHVVMRIQNYCNSNSSNPPTTCIGIIGTDRIFSQCVRAYVESLAHKSSSNWIQYLRFVPLPSPNSLFSKITENIDANLDSLCKELWDRFAEMTSSEKSGYSARLLGYSMGKTVAMVNLPIGEAMLQMTTDSESGGRIFLPFLCEVRVGNQQQHAEIGTDEDSGGNGNGNGPSASSATQKNQENIVVTSPRAEDSPPNSPHLRNNVDGQELNIDYWINSNLGSFPTSENVGNLAGNNGGPPTPNSKKDAAKVTAKGHFKTLFVSRSSSTGTLALTYLKEKRKDKMLQKLGMKKGQKQRQEGEEPIIIQSIGRMLCCASGKHNELMIIIDGIPYSGIRYFQTVPQWQTHVKSFPIAIFA